MFSQDIKNSKDIDKLLFTVFHKALEMGLQFSSMQGIFWFVKKKVATHTLVSSTLLNNSYPQQFWVF